MDQRCAIWTDSFLFTFLLHLTAHEYEYTCTSGHQRMRKLLDKLFVGLLVHITAFSTIFLFLFFFQMSLIIYYYWFVYCHGGNNYGWCCHPTWVVHRTTIKSRSDSKAKRVWVFAMLALVVRFAGGVGWCRCYEKRDGVDLSEFSKKSVRLVAD